MALADFIGAKKIGPASDKDIDALREELQRMKDEAAFEKRFGRCNEAQREFYMNLLAEEKRVAEAKERLAAEGEKARAAQAAKDAAYLAAEHPEIVCYINGKRAKFSEADEEARAHLSGMMLQARDVLEFDAEHAPGKRFGPMLGKKDTYMLVLIP